MGERTLRKLESGESELRPKEMREIASACGLPYEWFSVDFSRLPEIAGDLQTLEARMDELSEELRGRMQRLEEEVSGALLRRAAGEDGPATATPGTPSSAEPAQPPEGQEPRAQP